MLFRPLRAYHIGPFRVPFTPGILPRERGTLAKSIGRMVSRELLTPEIVRGRLLKDDIRLLVKELAEKSTGKIDEMYPALTAQLVDFLKQPGIRRELEAFGHKFLSGVIQKLSPTQRFFVSLGNYDSTLGEKMTEIVDDFINQIERLLNSGKVRGRIIRFIEERLGQDRVSEKIIALADRSIPGLLERFNIAVLVEDRINSLPMDRVERIVLDVMADKFLWIDIFGAILGFLIGLLQSLLNVFLTRI
jgi:uncharacterized membrane protein YheB (UPF0754 family)